MRGAVCLFLLFVKFCICLVLKLGGFHKDLPFLEPLKNQSSLCVTVGLTYAGLA